MPTSPQGSWAALATCSTHSLQYEQNSMWTSDSNSTQTYSTLLVMTHCVKTHCVKTTWQITLSSSAKLMTNDVIPYLWRLRQVQQMMNRERQRGGFAKCIQTTWQIQDGVWCNSVQHIKACSTLFMAPKTSSAKLNRERQRGIETHLNKALSVAQTTVAK